MNTYIPEIGDSIAATRKVPILIGPNTIVGPVVDTWSHACRIITNPGESIEGSFLLPYDTWNFRFLHKTGT